jgi:hypothetical protein
MEITECTLSMQCLTAGPGGDFNKILNDIISSERQNNIARINYSPRTLRNYMRQINCELGSAKPKNHGRISAYNDIRINHYEFMSTFLQQSFQQRCTMGT